MRVKNWSYSGHIVTVTLLYTSVKKLLEIAIYVGQNTRDCRIIMFINGHTTI